MEGEHEVSLEKALTRTVGDIDSTVKAANVVLSLLKRLRLAASWGDLKEISKGIDLTEQAMSALRQQFANTKEGWDIDEESYLSKGGFIKELLHMAGEAGLSIFEQDEKLFCYPVLLKVLPQERTILIDKVRERKIRPSFLINMLKKVQSKPIRFKPDVFLNALFEAYSTVVAAREANQIDVNETISGQVVPLMEIYRLFTLLPGQAKDYTREEFARDIYLLDQSGVARTKDGYLVTFPASTGTKSVSRTITIVTRDGQEKKYYGISFRREVQGERHEDAGMVTSN